VISLRAEGVTLRARAAGTYHLSMRYTPYWRVARGKACTRPNATWGTDIEVSRPGVVRLRFDLSARTLMSTVLGGSSGCAPVSVDRGTGHTL
jgi:hypothetical protein